MRPTYEHIPASPHQSWHLGLRAEPRFGFDRHYHPEYELTLIVAGSGRRYVGDRVADYGPGDLVLLGAETPHTWESEAAGWHEAVTVQFLYDAFGTGFFDRPEFHGVRRLLARSDCGLRFDGADGVPEAMVALSNTTDAARGTLAVLEFLVSLAGQPAETIATRSLVTDVDAAARERIDRVIGWYVATTPNASRSVRPRRWSRCHRTRSAASSGGTPAGRSPTTSTTYGWPRRPAG